jgi:hypothetical protein
MPTYTKLFNSIVTSTIWTEDDKTRIVWITMLAMSDKNGEVHASIPGLARVAGVSLQDCEMAIGKLLSPDEYSRTPDNEGRRIAKIDGGWELLNHAKYRLMASREDSKAATAERVRRHRNRNAPVTVCNAPVTVGRDIAEADTEAKADTENPPKGGVGGKADNIPTSPQAIRISELYGRRPTTKWSAREIKAYKAIPRESLENLDLVCKYTEAERAKGEGGRHRRDLGTFLNNFPGELDRARAWQGKSANIAPKPKQFIDEP